MERRGFLARLAGAAAALVAAPAAIDVAFDTTPPVVDSHAEELAAFDTALGKHPCADCGAYPTPLRPVVAQRSFGASYSPDGGYESTTEPVLREVALCDECAEVRERSALRYTPPVDWNTMPRGLVDITSRLPLKGLHS